MLEVGDRAPDFELESHLGSLVSLGGLVERGDVVLYFYPADFSPVCTAQACAFRDGYQGVADLGVEIVGISPQDAASHRRFAERFDIPFPLLSDPRKAVVRAYGVDGPFGFGVRRVTFLIDGEKVVRNRVVADLLLFGHLELLAETVRRNRGPRAPSAPT